MFSYFFSFFIYKKNLLQTYLSIEDIARELRNKKNNYTELRGKQHLTAG